MDLSLNNDPTDAVDPDNEVPRWTAVLPERSGLNQPAACQNNYTKSTISAGSISSSDGGSLLLSAQESAIGVQGICELPTKPLYKKSRQHSKNEGLPGSNSETKSPLLSPPDVQAATTTSISLDGWDNPKICQTPAARKGSRKRYHAASDRVLANPMKRILGFNSPIAVTKLDDPRKRGASRPRQARTSPSNPGPSNPHPPAETNTEDEPLSISPMISQPETRPITEEQLINE
ncbi:hypothetical protein AJ80_10070, partial [Polytolypa hystricis UAMH7299]